MGYLWMTLIFVFISYGVPHLNTGGDFYKIVDGSFKNVDSNNDGYIEKHEFNTTINTADSDKDGCLTLKEYKGFSAGGPQIATRIYKHFDKLRKNCIKVENVASQFAVMDQEKNGNVTKSEFRQYYVNLLQILFPPV
ncbi:uncharacterized protein LOC123554610 [Mercenaria mercenaria]|uniref:uncharacterized protein LOC123554610 n=1 Tax=Mercenaria mercenaria TaxID=6596 RepID=UPI00234E55BC|nr:uncharacterized protein LOC123554610 [Mercenaria mercenaria]